ncbi:MAG: hypothetical protein R8K20_08615 [Gallionellaceae bacterium]
MSNIKLFQNQEIRRQLATNCSQLKTLSTDGSELSDKIGQLKKMVAA